MANLLLKRIKDWATSITSFRTGDVIPVDGPSGTAKMSKDDLLKETAQNALVGNIAQEFYPTRTSENPYKAGESVARNGVAYLFKAPHYGEWSWNDVEPYNGKIIENPINGYLCELQGAGDEPVYDRFFARSSSCLRIVPHQTTWDTTGLVSPHYKLVLRARLENGSIVDLKAIGASDAVPEIIDVEIPASTAWFEVYARAATGTMIYFDVLPFDSVMPKSIPNKTSFETGNITMSPSGLTYGEHSKRARTKNGELVQVKKGDVVGVKSGFQMYVAFSTTGAAPYTVVGWTTSYTFAEDGYAALLFRKGIGSDSPTTFDELMSAVYVRAYDSELSVIPYLASKVEETFSILTKTLYGADTTAVSWKFKAYQNSTYRIVPSKTVWNVSNIGGEARAKLAIRKILADNSVQDVEAYFQNGPVPSVLDVVVPSDAVLMEIYFRADVGESVSFEVLVQEQHGLSVPPRNGLLKSVNHRGYNTIAPENTLPAYRLSAKMGFGIVETDVHLTSDGKFVCIHDDTVDRTSDGTGNVADKTLAELKALDFGSWKSVTYAGTKIPTYEEFLICCRNLGLKAYVEVKSGGSYDKLISITESFGMMDAVTFISSSVSALTAIKNIKDSVRLGYVVETINSTVISSANSLKTGRNEVFLDCKNSSLTDTMIDVAAEAGLPIEVWTVNSIQTILGLSPYISGVTSDSLVASKYVYADEIDQ